MKIWRIETEDGTGPYRHEVTREAYVYDRPSYLRQTWSSERHPHPVDDGMDGCGSRSWPMIPSEMHFGFSNREMLDNWFFEEPEDARRMEALGLLVRVYEVPDEDVRLGHSQAMFLRDRQEMVDTMRPTVYAENRTKELT